MGLGVEPEDAGERVGEGDAGQREGEREGEREPERAARHTLGLGTLVGTLLIGVLYSGLAINNVNPYYQPIIIGLIVVLSVYVDQLAKRRRRG